MRASGVTLVFKAVIVLGIAVFVLKLIGCKEKQPDAPPIVKEWDCSTIETAVVFQLRYLKGSVSGKEAREMMNFMGGTSSYMQAMVLQVVKSDMSETGAVKAVKDECWKAADRYSKYAASLGIR